MLLLFLYKYIFLSNNKVGGDFIIRDKNKLNFFWKVGKFTVEKSYCCDNIISKCSRYLSYYFGNSTMFSCGNIIFMRKFYRYFPIFLDEMNKLSWDSYLELLKLKNQKACYFYFNLSLFCNYDFEDLKLLIDSNLYFRI